MTETSSLSQISKKLNPSYFVTVLNKTPLRHAVRAMVDALHWQQRRVRISSLTDVGPLSEKESHCLNELRTQGFTNLADITDRQILIAAQAYVDEKVRSQHNSELFTHKHFWKRLSDDDFQTGYMLSPENPLTKILLQKSIVRLVSQYLGEVPVVDYTLITNSTHSADDYQMSQLWHLDRDDVRMVKIFIYFSDVLDTKSGPFTLLDKNESKKVHIPVKGSHQRDDVVFSQADPSKAKPMYGPKLTIFAVDTSQCMHFGSRVAEGHNRLMFTGLLRSFPAIYPGANRQVRPNEVIADPIERLLLRHC